MDNHDEILRTREYKELWVCRTGKACSLVVVANGESHVYSDAQGKTRQFRHAWQIKEWLHQKFGIEIDKLEVKNFR